MVKITNRAMERSELEEKSKRLESIAKEELGIQIIVHSCEYDMLFLIEDIFDLAEVYLEKNKITLFNPQNYERIHKLAERYEKETGEKWTLKKDYSE